MTLPRTPSFRLEGRRALVTGASRGIGLGCAMALAEAGAHVVMVARGAEVLQAAVAEMQAEGLSAEAVVQDIADLDGLRALFAAQGPFDVVVNSAGVARHGPALEATPENFDLVMGLNVKAAYFLAIEAARGMIAAGKGGSIIQISSQMGHVGGIDRSIYCASKHALEGMTKAQAIEWGPHGIRVNTLGPTFIRTPLTEATFKDPARVAWIEEKIKLGRVGEISDIMGAVVYLASDAGALVTGGATLVDGGWTAG